MITRLRNQKGSVAVLVTAAMTVLLGFASIVVDVGVLYLNRVQLSNMVVTCSPKTKPIEMLVTIC